MRIAMVSSQFPPLWGGVGATTYWTAVKLAERGHQVDLVTRRFSKGQRTPDLPEGLSVHHVPMAPLPMAFAASFGNNAVKWLLGSEERYDVLHNHSNMCLLSHEHYDEVPYPIVSTIHGTWRGERSMISWRDVTPSLESLNDLAVLYLSPIFDQYEDHAIELSDAIIVQCDSEIEAIARRGVENRHGRMVKLPAGISADTYHPDRADPEVVARYGADPDRPVVLAVNRLAARKGVFDMLDIIARTRRDIPDTQLLVVGTGPQEASMRKRIASLGLEGAVRLTGPIPFPDLQALYATADAVLFTSFWEGQGLVPGEAMSSGTPPVATEVGWVPELIEQGQNGYHFPVHDVEAAAGHLEKLLTDEGLRQRLGQRGRQDVLDRWEWEHHIDRLEKVYQEVLGDA